MQIFLFSFYHDATIISILYCLYLLLCLKLFEKGCGTNDYDAVSGCTPLHFMARAASRNISDGETGAKCTQLLLDRGASVHMRDLWTGMMPLHYAALFNSPLVIEKILNHKHQLGNQSFLSLHFCSTVVNSTFIQNICLEY